MELFRRTLAGMLMLVVAVSVGIWVQGRFIDAVRLPTHTRMIGATYTTLSDPFYETINDEIQMQIKSNGDLLLVRDPGQDQERQNQEIEDMLNKGMAQSSGAQIQLEESLAGLTLSQDEEDCVYRTVQEGITNAIRHGHATRVQVRCHIEDGVLEVSVRDNGIGCKSVTPGFGLQHMQERMLMLGGTFWYENSDGFCIRAEIPLRKTPGSEKRKQEETV